MLICLLHLESIGKKIDKHMVFKCTVAGIVFRMHATAKLTVLFVRGRIAVALIMVLLRSHCGRIKQIFIQKMS